MPVGYIGVVVTEIVIATFPSMSDARRFGKSLRVKHWSLVYCVENHSRDQIKTPDE